MKNQNKPDLLIEYLETIPDYVIKESFNSIKDCGINIKLNKREVSIWAAIEWTIPTVIAAYIFKPYFETFLKEAGKQHYKILSEKLKNFLKKGKEIKTDLVTATKSTNKISNSYNQSKTISILIETRNGRFIKLLFDDNLDKNDWDNAIDQLFEYIIDNYENPSTNKLDELTKTYKEHINHKYYAIINKETKEIEFFDDSKLINITRQNKNK